MLHIKLKKIAHASNMVANVNLTLGVGSIDQGPIA